ncbi:hypothetical protein B0H10DRAFT_1800811 [Mycena sp. CBHHK59/15]|nr:hypothetical protein B0H10DRAFT_1800811 [Mycena sp. CBHHK59/15]
MILSVKALGADANIEKTLRMNPYLQTWSPTKADLSKDLQKMMKVGEKYELQLEDIAISREIQRDMPIWYHKKSSATCALFNLGPKVKCLRKNHGTRLVRDVETLSHRLGSNRHRARRDCDCNACKETRRECRPGGCRNPHKCYLRARAMLSSLQNKWNPLQPQPEDYEEEPGVNGGPEQDPDMMEFNPNVKVDPIHPRRTSRGAITDAFHIFTKPLENPEMSNSAPDTRHVLNPNMEMITVYTDGSASGNGTDGVRAGTGIYYGEDDPRNRAIKVPDEWGPSNQVGEVLGVKESKTKLGIARLHQTHQ